MQVISLFSGIGGFEIAAEAAGWDVAVSCEINPFGRGILEHYWPNAYHHGDIHTLTYEKICKYSRWDPTKPTIVVGGFPCQPFSLAGKRRGTDDSRHLWPEMLRIIREVGPTWVVGENVLGIINWSGGLVFEQVQADLEAEGYEVQPYVLPACGVGAPHRRDRVWFVAHRKERFDPDTANRGRERIRERVEVKNGEREGSRKTGQLAGGLEGLREERVAADPLRRRQPGEEHGEAEPRRFTEDGVPNFWENFPTKSPICRGNDGFSGELVRAYVTGNSGGVLTEKEIDGIVSKTISKFNKESIKSFGNAIVPQVAERIFMAINEYEKLTLTN